MPFNWLSSIGNNITERARNPFLGTFAFVWLARNWELVFALFNFDDSYTLETKINFLNDRIKYDAFWTELFANVMWTFFVLVLTYLLINIARFITNMFENRLTPFIYSISSEGKIVTKEKYDLRINEIENLEIKLEKERKKRIATEAEIERIETKERDRTLADLSATRLDEVDLDAHLDYNPIEQKLIDKFKKENIYQVLDMALNGLEIPKGKKELNLISEDLAKFEFLEKKYSTKDRTSYGITNSGKSLWKQLYK